VFLIVALGVLNVVTYAGLTRPRWYEVTAQSRAREEARQARRVLEPALDQARANYGLVLQAENDLEELKARIAASAESVASVVNGLEAKLAAVGMQLGSGSYAREEIDELDLLLLQMAIPLTGQYSSVRQLVESLASGEGFTTIDQVALASPDQTRQGGSLQVEFLLASFLPATNAGPLSRAAGESDRPPEAGQEPADPDPTGEESPVTEVDPAVGEIEEADTAQGERESDSEPPESPTDPRIDEETGALDREGAPARSGVSPVDRARELQARLASLPPLPFPPEAYDVRLGELDRSTEASTAPGRNLFDFVRRRQAGAGTQPGAEPARPGGGQRPAQQQQRPAVASQPSIPLRLLGVVRVGTVWYASMTDGSELHVAAEGGSLPGGYLILKIGVDYVDVQVGEQQVRLTLES
jgi:hypothetical protein